LDERLIRYLKLFVVGGGVVLVLGTVLLVALLVQRQAGGGGGAERRPAAAPDGPATSLALPADARIGQALAAGNQLVLLGEVPDGRRFLAVVDLASGRRRHLLWITPEGAPR
jgi:hypothetical protein